MSIEKNFAFYQGEAISLQITIVDANNAVVDITGYTIRFRLAQLDGTVALENTTTPGTITIPTGTDGLIVIPITKAVSSLLSGDYVHGIARTNAGAEAILSNGQVTVALNPALP